MDDSALGAAIKKKFKSRSAALRALGIDPASVGLADDEAPEKNKTTKIILAMDGKTNMTPLHNNLPADVRSARIRYTTADGRRVFLSTDEDPEPGEERGEVDPDYMGRVYAD
jgi:hypothetical protein